MFFFGLLLLIAAVTSVCTAQDTPTTAPSPTKKKNKGMEGRIKIAGNIFQVSCDCSEHALQNAASHVESAHKAASCRQPTKLHVFADRVSSMSATNVMTTSELQTRLPSPQKAEIADSLKRTLDYTHKKETKSILGSMGGEIGEFILALSVYSQMLGIEDTSKMDVRPYLEQWLNFTKSQGRMMSFQYDVDAFKVLQESVAGLDDRSVIISNENQPATAQVAPEKELITKILGEAEDSEGLRDPRALGECMHVVLVVFCFVLDIVSCCLVAKNHKKIFK